ncbi:MAG: hypothetical protein Kow00109_07420 [Acidobacteriota bacterium]
MRRAFWGLVVIGMIFTTAVAAQPTGFKPGQWEIKIKMKIEGAPFAMPEQTVKQCLTEEDWAPKPTPPGETGEAQCKIVRQEVSGNRASYEMECTSKDGTMKMTGETSYSGDTFEGAMQMEGHGGDLEGMKMSFQMKGKYLGPCSK